VSWYGTGPGWFASWFGGGSWFGSRLWSWFGPWFGPWFGAWFGPPTFNPRPKAIRVVHTAAAVAMPAAARVELARAAVVTLPSTPQLELRHTAATAVMVEVTHG